MVFDDHLVDEGKLARLRQILDDLQLGSLHIELEEVHFALDERRQARASHVQRGPASPGRAHTRGKAPRVNAGHEEVEFTVRSPSAIRGTDIGR